jgi:hypothetical protein
LTWEEFLGEKPVATATSEVSDRLRFRAELGREDNAEIGGVDDVDELEGARGCSLSLREGFEGFEMDLTVTTTAVDGFMAKADVTKASLDLFGFRRESMGVLGGPEDKTSRVPLANVGRTVYII